ncbi:hypothetical protein DXG01_013093 [Tephrocybe rancida]|nr:hypothetical protein DXG01_013093 [Tephrocybe rancida]
MHFDGIHNQVKQGGEWQKEYSKFCSANNFKALHTHVTTGTGGLHMHMVFLTISNIFSDMWQKATLHTWLCIGFLPIPDFAVHSKIQTLLAARIWH